MPGTRAAPLLESATCPPLRSCRGRSRARPGLPILGAGATADKPANAARVASDHLGTHRRSHQSGNHPGAGRHRDPPQRGQVAKVYAATTQCPRSNV